MMPESETEELSPRSKYGSLEKFNALYATERQCRAAFERMIWPEGPVCPHCGGVESWRFRDKGRKSRAGLLQCKACNGQFTVTTNTPMHSTKLPLRTWLLAIYLMFASSKGMSSVVLARHLGVCQKTAWKIGHAIREMLFNRADVDRQLHGVVEADTTYVGGAPKQIKHVYNPRGKGTSKQPVLITTEREGPTRMDVIENEKADTFRPVLFRNVERDAVLMTDGDKALAKVGKDFAEHHAVRHREKEYVFEDIHVNRAEAFSMLLRRSVAGVYHYLSRKHLQRYLNEMAFRWGHRKLLRVRTKRGKIAKYLAVAEFEAHLCDLLQTALGRKLLYTNQSGIRYPHEAFLRPAKRSTKQQLAMIQAGREGGF